jgi:hypothetical protein
MCKGSKTVARNGPVTALAVRRRDGITSMNAGHSGGTLLSISSWDDHFVCEPAPTNLPRPDEFESLHGSALAKLREWDPDWAEQCLNSTAL